MRTISREAAGRFILRHQGLLGGHRFHGSGGVMDFTRQAGCVQFDPVNLCGRSPELVYHARIPGFQADWLERHLYLDRALVDHFDKNLAIFPREDWPMLKVSRERWARAGRGQGRIAGIRHEVLNTIREKGPQTAASLGLLGRVDWYWASTSLSRAALEQLYYEGELLVHSKQGVLKTYDLKENCLPRHILELPEAEPGPLQTAWHLPRRVRAIGLLWNRASDAWLGSDLYYQPARARAFAEALEAGSLLPLRVDGLKDTLYLAARDELALENALKSTAEEPRCELIAPLDSLLWDRRLIEALFDFKYTWEIYTKPEKRAYAAYALPILMDGRFVGRVAPVCDRKAGLMRLEGLWWEEGRKPDRRQKTALKAALRRLAAYNGCAFDQAI